MTLDVHVLVMPDTPDEWAQQRRDSIAEAVRQAGFPVNVFELPGVAGHIGLARAAGYSMGDAPYATYVDDDDWLEPNAFSVLAPHLDGATDALFTREFVHTDDGRVVEGPAWHHLCVYRRPLLAAIPFDELTWAVDIHCRREAEGRVTVEIPEAVYHYRARGRSYPVRAMNPDEQRPRPFDAEAMPAAYWRGL